MSVGDSAVLSETPLSGPLLFARYAYPPNELGYCGPSDASALIDSATEAGGESELGHLAKQFDGAWPYLELIASCNGISDPLDRRVVEAYWVGNELHVAYPRCRWRRRSTIDLPVARSKLRAAGIGAFTGGVIQHSFTCRGLPVFGLLRAGKEGAPLQILDRCRIRWGQVLNVDGDFVTVKSRSLKFEGSHLRLGTEGLEVVRRALGGVVSLATWLRATWYPCTGTGCATGCPTRHLVGSRTARE